MTDFLTDQVLLSQAGVTDNAVCGCMVCVGSQGLGFLLLPEVKTVGLPS